MEVAVDQSDPVRARTAMPELKSNPVQQRRVQIPCQFEVKPTLYFDYPSAKSSLTILNS